MQAVLCNLTASLLLIQAVTGWCWHAPADCAKCHQCMPHELFGTTCCQDHQCEPIERPEGSPAPCDGESECHGFCTYVAPQETRLDTAQVPLPFDIAPVVMAGADHQFLTAFAWERACHFGASEPPLRLHLLHQLLLI